jgi:hypothetical protein
MLRRRPLLFAAAAIALAAAGAGVVLATQGGSSRAAGTTGAAPGKASQASGKNTYAQLVAANYRILKPKQSTRLLRYAAAAFACMSRDLALGKPRTSPTKIVMTLPPGAKPSAVLRSMGRCAMTIGDPPSGSSFQFRGNAVLVYLPKYCILDKKTIARTAPLQQP